MKRITKIVIALILVVSTLSGCSAYMESLPDRVHTYEDLTITIPGKYYDQSAEPWAEPLAFFYSYSGSAIAASKKPRQEVEKEHPGMTALEYAQNFAKDVNLTEPVEEKDGLITFCHTIEAENGMEFTYLCSTYASKGFYWLLQVYCPSDVFAESREDMTKILRSVTVQ